MTECGNACSGDAGNPIQSVSAAPFGLVKRNALRNFPKLEFQIAMFRLFNLSINKAMPIYCFSGNEPVFFSA